MINKYQIYHLYKVLSGLKTAKRFTNKVYKDLTTKSVKDILEEDFYYTPNVDKSANVFIDLVNSINSGQFTVNDFAISIVNEYMITEKFPTLLSCGKVDNRQKFFISASRWPGRSPPTGRTTRTARSAGCSPLRKTIEGTTGNKT